MKREELSVKGVKYYFNCSTCDTRTFFDDFSTAKECPNCGTKNNLKTAIILEDDNYEDLTAYSDLKLVGIKIKTRRN